jgi:hypothetical protein
MKEAVFSVTSEMALKIFDITGEESLCWEPKNTLDPCDIPPADRRKGQQIFIDGKLDALELIMTNRTLKPAVVTMHLRKEFFGEDIKTAEAVLPAGEKQIVRFDFGLYLPSGSYVFILDPVKDVSFAVSAEHLPGFFRKADGCYHNFNNFAFNILPEQHPFKVENLHNNFGRPSSDSPNIWIAEAGFPQALTALWKQQVSFDRIDLIFDTNLDEYRYNETAPECVKDFTVEYEKDGQWHTVATVKDNCYRFRRFDLPEAVSASAIRVNILASRGDKYARIYGIHAYLKNN